MTVKSIVLNRTTSIKVGHRPEKRRKIKICDGHVTNPVQTEVHSFSSLLYTQVEKAHCSLGLYSLRLDEIDVYT